VVWLGVRDVRGRTDTYVTSKYNTALKFESKIPKKKKKVYCGNSRIRPVIVSHTVSDS